MANPFEVASFNLTNFANIYPDLMDDEPKDVEYVYKDENGNIRTKSVANRGKFKKQLWDDVGGALRQFYRIFYVDSINGNDNNDGGELTPFKTLRKACDSIPVGGYGKIYLKSDIEIESDIVLMNKIIHIIPDSTSNKRVVRNKAYFYDDAYGCRATGFILENSNLYFHYLTIQTANFPDDGVDYTTKPNYYTGLIVRKNNESGNLIVCSETTVFLGDTPFARLSNRQTMSFIFYNRNYKFYDFTIQCNGANIDGKLIHNEAGTIRIDYSNVVLGVKLDGTTLTYDDLITGVVRDSNGIPRNILSNVIF